MSAGALTLAAVEWGCDPTDVRAVEEACAPDHGGRLARWWAAHATPEDGSCPPLPDRLDGGVPYAVVLAAARALAPLAGGPRISGDPTHRGGWDSADHWGLGAGRLRDCYCAARGEERGWRFRALLRWCYRHPGEAPPACRSLSDRQVWHLLRCRVDAALEREERLWVRISLLARVALGRLSYVQQRAALWGAAARAEQERAGQPVRIRHLDWEVVRHCSRAVRLDEWRAAREIIRHAEMSAAEKEEHDAMDPQ